MTSLGNLALYVELALSRTQTDINIEFYKTLLNKPRMWLLITSYHEDTTSNIVAALHSCVKHTCK